MNPDQFAYFRQRYAGMHDDELAVIIATRREVLSEEAEAALVEVARSRNIAALVAETNAVVNDLNQQAAAAQAELLRQQEHNRQVRKAMTYFVLGVAVIAAAMAVYYKS